MEVLRRLRQALRGKLSHKVLLLYDNAPAHAAKIAQAAIKECNLKQLRHLPYSSDLAPSDFYLFRLLKKNLRGRRFSSDEESRVRLKHGSRVSLKIFISKDYSRSQ